MRVTTLLKKVLAIKHVVVKDVEDEPGGLVLDVKPSWRKPRCSGCGTIRPGYDTLKPRFWRHIDLGVITLHLSPLRSPARLLPKLRGGCRKGPLV